MQLNLRRRFLKEGYNVGQISTEPTGYLFGMDYTFPIGYNGSIKLAHEAMSLFVNDIMYECNLKEPHIILVGSQSSTVSAARIHSSHFAYHPYEFMMGALPDAVLLMVNNFDAVKYIKRTIAFIESSADCPVVACVISPVAHNNPIMFSSSSELAEQINKPVFQFGEIEEIYQSTIRFFSGQR